MTAKVVQAEDNGKKNAFFLAIVEAQPTFEGASPQQYNKVFSYSTINDIETIVDNDSKKKTVAGGCTCDRQPKGFSGCKNDC